MVIQLTFSVHLLDFEFDFTATALWKEVSAREYFGIVRFVPILNPLFKSGFELINCGLFTLAGNVEIVGKSNCYFGANGFR